MITKVLSLFQKSQTLTLYSKADKKINNLPSPKHDRADDNDVDN